MRNRMIHGYFETNFDLVRETVGAEIPPVIARLTAILADDGT